MTDNHEEKRRLAAEDRAALRSEIATGEGDGTRLEAFDVLAKKADEEEAEAPPMPEGLRDKLVEKFGSPEPKQPSAPKRSTPAAAPAPGFFAQLREFFAGRQLAYGGGLAVAACALLLTVFLPKGDGVNEPGKVDALRGGDTAPELKAEVAIYLFPQDKAAAVVAVMSPDRPATLCADLDDLNARIASDQPVFAVAADLDARTVVVYRDGKRGEESPIAGASATDVLLEVRAAADAASTGVE